MIDFEKYNDTYDAFDDDGAFTITCDECDNTLKLEGTWQVCWLEAKDMGWHAYKDDNDWKHRCPDCSKDNSLHFQI